MVVRFTGDDDRYGHLTEALHAFLRICTVTPAARRALRLVEARDTRLSPYRDYRAVLGDQELRSAVAAVLALPCWGGLARPLRRVALTSTTERLSPSPPHHSRVPGAPLNGPRTSAVIQPP